MAIAFLVGGRMFRAKGKRDCLEGKRGCGFMAAMQIW